MHTGRSFVLTAAGLLLGAVPVQALGAVDGAAPAPPDHRGAAHSAIMPDEAAALPEEDGAQPEPDAGNAIGEPQSPEYVQTLVRIDPDIVERRDELVALIEDHPGWALGQDHEAEFEIVPNPEFYQDLLFSRIKRRQFDRLQSSTPDRAMDIADIMIATHPETGMAWIDQRGKGRVRDPRSPEKPHWALTVPLPTDLGPADGDELLPRLRDAMRPIARHHALLGLVADQPQRLKVCVTHEELGTADCPAPPDYMLYFKPFHITARGAADLDATHVTFLAVAPDRAIRHLATVPVARVAVIGPDGTRAALYSEATNADDPARLEDLGHYQIVAIASPEPLDPRIWSLGPDDVPPAGLCEGRVAAAACAVMGGVFDTTANLPLAAGIVQFRVFTDRMIAVAPAGGGLAGRGEGEWQAQLFQPRPGPAQGFSGVLSPGGGRRLNFEKSHKCGGSYIGRGLILTAAHCVDKVALDELQVRLGTFDIANGGSNFPITSMVIHQNFRRSSGKADIALLRIRTDRRLETLLRKGWLASVPLAPADLRLPDETDLAFTGWGYTSPATAGGDALVDEDGNTQRNARYLVKVDVQSRASEECTRFRQLRVYAANDIVCTKPVKEREGACFSDSGGPLTEKVGNRRRLVGLVSAGIGCAQPGMPTVFTRVANFRDWIRRAETKSLQPGKHRMR